MSETAGSKVSDHMANERIYLAWVRTGITVIALGFVVAKFGIIVKEFAPNAPETSFHFSSIIGIALVVSGTLMELLGACSFQQEPRDDQDRKVRTE